MPPWKQGRLTIVSDAAYHSHPCAGAGQSRVAGTLGVWRSLVARQLWELDVGGSNPSTPTIDALPRVPRTAWPPRHDLRP